VAIDIYRTANKDFFPANYRPESLGPTGDLGAVRFNGAGWVTRLALSKCLPADWSSYSIRRTPFFCPTDDITPIDPTFWYTQDLPTLSSYRAMGGVAHDGGFNFNWPGPWTGGGAATVNTPLRISGGPSVNQYGLRKGIPLPMLVEVVGPGANDGWGGGVVPWSNAFWEPIGNPTNNWVNSVRHGAKDGSRSILFTDSHVEFGPIRWGDPGPDEMFFPGRS